jgi:hypothetical protein
MLRDDFADQGGLSIVIRCRKTGMPGWSLGMRLFGQAHLVRANAANRISASSLKADLVDAE